MPEGFGFKVREFGVIGHAHLGYASNFRCSFTRSAAARTGNEDVHGVRKFFGGCHQRKRRALKTGVIVFGNHKYCHFRFPSVLKNLGFVFENVDQFINACVTEGVRSTPRLAASSVSTGFLRAFIMLGSVT